jgi:hypothetical protein
VCKVKVTIFTKMKDRLVMKVEFIWICWHQFNLVRVIFEYKYAFEKCV